MADYPAALKERVHTFLEEDEWDFIFFDKDNVFVFYTRIEETGQQLNYMFELCEHTLLLHCDLNQQISPDHFSEAALLLARINFQTAEGNFMLNPENGAVRLKTSLSLRGSRIPSRDTLRKALYVSMHEAIVYAPCFEAVEQGNSAREAILLCQND